MNIKQFIEFLQTLPQDATVQVLSHSRGTGYYDQGGNCTVEDFSYEWAEFMSYTDDNNELKWAYGQHFEFNTVDGKKYLQLGVMDK